MNQLNAPIETYELPTSYTQQRMCFFDRLVPDNSVYNMAGVVRFDGYLHVEVLEKSLQEIVNRHEILRTTFEETEGTFVQVIRERATLSLTHLHWQDNPQEVRDTNLNQLIRLETRRPFDLQKGPLLRMTLVWLGEEEYVLIFVLHHIIADGWSMGVLINELATLYESILSGKPNPLPELELQFGDYANWQKEYLQGELLEQELTYWNQKLAGAPTVLSLPTDRTRVAEPLFEGGVHRFAISDQLTQSLHHLARQEGATLFMVLLSTFQTLLHRYTGEQDLLVGSPVANRSHRDLERLIGPFVNTLILRSQWAPGMSFRQLLQQVRSNALEAFAHQEVPFDKLVEELNPERQVNVTPLVQVMFALQNVPSRSLKLPNVKLTSLETGKGMGQFDLTLIIEETEQGLAGALHYNAELFEQSTIDRMSKNLTQLMLSVVENPDGQIAELPLLTKEEKHQLLTEWNDTTVPFSDQNCVHELFEAQVERAPDRIALECDGNKWTYRELNRRANQLARYLKRKGVGVETRVGIFVDRSLDMYAAVLGVLKAGATYVPLSTSYPRDRISYMLEDAEVAVLLTHENVVNRLPDHSAEVIRLDTDRLDIGKETDCNLPNTATPQKLCYIIYTSGTTGQPKGVMIEHRGLCNFVEGEIRAYDMRLTDRILPFFSFGFDGWCCTNYSGLLSGATLVLVSEVQLMTELVAELREHCITLVMLPPSILGLMPETECLPNLRTIATGGEAVSAEIVERWGKNRRFLNAYGPSEITVAATWAELQGLGKPLIGRPYDNKRVYVLDANGQPVPIGVPGELYIGGVGTARGYLNRPDLTEERFLPNPFSNDPSDRLYRSGDLVKYRPNGQLEFLGRVDHQVKIRGFRVEIGEVETVMSSLTGIQQAIVIVHETQQGDKRLVAYLLPDEDAILDANKLRESLHQKLPDFMIPSAFVFLRHIPLLPNGKVDLHALPKPELSNSGKHFVAPRTELERKVADVWAEVLDLVEVGIEDTFFELGGHSLLAIRLIGRLEKEFGVSLSLKALFDGATVANQVMALQADGSFHASVEQEIMRIRPVSREGKLHLSPAQMRIWFLEQMEQGSNAYNIPSAMWMHGELCEEAFEESLRELVSRHEILFAYIQMEDGELVHRLKVDMPLPFERVDLEHLTDPAKQARFEITKDLKRSFDLANGPLWRICLYKIANNKHLMYLNVHHIIADAWSMSVLIRDFITLYVSRITGQSPVLLELPIQFIDYASWTLEESQKTVWEDQLSFWCKQLQGQLPYLTLPTDKTKEIGNAGGKLSALLSPQLTESLKNIGKSAGVSLFNILLSTFYLLLHRLTGQEDIIVGTPFANRNQRETEGIVGLMLNTLALRIDLAGQPTFAELLTRVREMTAEAFSNQDVPFEHIVQAVQPERKLHDNPIFDVMINLINTPQVALELPDLSFEPATINELDAKFLLSLYLQEQENGLQMNWVYKKSLLLPERVQGMIDQFILLLEQIVVDINRPIGCYTLITPAFKQQLPDLREVIEEPAYPLVTELIAKVAAREGRMPAVVQGKHTLAFAELEQRSQNIANRILQYGVKRGEAVAVCGTRNIGLVVAFLAVLKSGAVLVPIDQTLPIQRQLLMLSESNARTVLHVASEPLPAEYDDVLPENRVLYIDPQNGMIMMSDVAVDLTSPMALKPDDPAFLFFTSGTTGVPKGVLGTQKGLAHFMHWQRTCFEVGQKDRVAQLIHLSFDAVLRDVFLPLTSGAVLCLPEETDELGVDALLTWLERERITIVHTVPSLAQAWINYRTSDVKLTRLRYLFLSGESLTDNLVTQWRTVFSGTGEIVNLYGPTETTMIKCYYRVPDEPRAGVQPAGWSMPETQAIVLNDAGEICGIGEPGQIVLRTPFRTLGYVNASAETAKAFVPNPWRSDLDDLLYCTGDKGRYRPDGALEILGRMDDQVKIRGVRIQLSEIQAVLEHHPSVQSSVVLDHNEMSGQASLVAYVILKAGRDADADVLRTHLEQQLSPAMIPSYFVFLDRMPLLANGKLNRKALPAPQETAVSANENVPPRTRTEVVLHRIWSDILKKKVLGIHENFFVMGGHSLLATQVVSRIRQELYVEVPLRALFEYKSIARLAELVDRLQTEAHDMETQIPKVPRDQPLPLSFAQQRLWFMNQLDENSYAYNMPLVMHMKGNVRADLLEATFNAIIKNHESLRTNFILVNDEPRQQIVPVRNLVLKQVDLRDHPIEERYTTREQILHTEARTSFDLREDLLIRATLIRTEEAEYSLSVTLHHIITDFWSMGVFLREFVEIYKTLLDEQLLSDRERNVQYADFSSWQHACMKGEIFQKQLTYWKEQLGGTLPVLQLPTDRPRPAKSSGQGANRKFSIPIEKLERVRKISLSESVTPFMVLFAAFNTLLYRYTEQEDIILGTPIANRTHADIEGLIGFFVNTLALRTDLSGNPTFRELLGRVREMTLGAYAHQDLPYEKLIEELLFERDTSINPIFQVMFVLQNTPFELDGLPGIDIRIEDVNRGAVKFDLLLTMTETERGLLGTMEYSTDLYDVETIDRMIEGYKTLIDSILDDPNQTVQELDILSEAERHKIMSEWNDTYVDYPRGLTVPEMFATQVERTPEATGIVCGERRFTYREINCRANQLAHYLQHQGVGPEVLVGIFMKRSAEMLIGLLAIIKAGGAYVSLDVNYPTDRTVAIIQAANMSFILTEQDQAIKLPETDAIVLMADSLAEEIRLLPVENTVSTTREDHLIYVVYTSGSTGVPKGVAIEHRNVNAFLHWFWEVFSYEELKACLFATSICFDVSTHEIFASLCSGGTVYVAKDALHLSTLPARNEITMITTVPSAITELLRINGIPTSVRIVGLAGEPLHSTVVEQLYALGHIEKVYNFYGPTEDTVYSTMKLTRPGEKVNIGRIISNTRGYVLDKRQKLVPIGVMGELYLASDSLARGYLGQPEVTNQHFVPNPFSVDPSPRAYRTGDIVRYMPNGELEFIGRMDHQVKVRGFRIELTEIESLLSKHPLVRSSVVIVDQIDQYDKRLIAYVEPKSGKTLTIAELRTYVSSKLASYMVPSAIILLEEFPLLPNGKVNRNALPAPSVEQHLNGVSYVAPRNLEELQLVTIWEEIFNIKPISIKDNFFELGGHSLLAVRMIATLKTRTDRSLPLGSLFQAGTIEQLATLMREESLSVHTSSLVKLKPSGSKTPFFCVHPVGGTVFGYSDLARLLDPEQPFYALQARGLDLEEQPLASVSEMASLYIEKICTVQEQGPYLLGGWSMGGAIAFEMARQLKERGEEVSSVIMFDTSLPQIEDFADYENELSYAAEFTQSEAKRRGFEVPIDVEEINQLPYNEALTSYLELGKRFNLFPTELELDRFKRLLEINVVNNRAHYQHQTRMVDVPVVLLRASERPMEGQESTLKWSSVAGSVEVIDVPGDHVTIVSYPNVQVLAEKLQLSLDQAASKSGRVRFE